MYDAMLAETVTIRGDGGDEIEAYLARPMSPGPHGGVVVIHHMPGYDAPTKEIVRPSPCTATTRSCRTSTTARHPAPPDDAAAAARAQGGVPDDRLTGDVAGGGRVPARPDLRQRQGRRHRLLLGRPAGVLAACSLPWTRRWTATAHSSPAPRRRACR